MAGRGRGAALSTRAQALSEDLSGPYLNLPGTAAETFQDGDDTCFAPELGGGGWSGLAAGRLLACYPGP